MQSEKFSLNKDDLKALAINTLKVAAGAAAEYALAWATHQEWGIYKGFVMAGVAGALDLLHKYLQAPQ